VKCPHATHSAPCRTFLRFNTCGSVDDGKSTLIGRLLYDSKSLMEDQIEALERSADITGGGQINLANLTDGLRAEREQGITIDVAYRYFATPKRKFIVADTPGHVQYTRNMVTGARRRTFPSCSSMRARASSSRRAATRTSRRCCGIPHLVIAINKMDLVGWSEERFLEIRDEFEDSCRSSTCSKDVKFIPISALNGDNVVDASKHTPWYPGPTLLGHLETSTSPATGISGLPVPGAMGESPEQSHRSSCTTSAASAARSPAASCARSATSRHGAAQRHEERRSRRSGPTTVRCRRRSARSPSPSCLEHDIDISAAT
jgi:sulfate adenylyltransferase subunit 1 (EFTu-like GTPase family)